MLILNGETIDVGAGAMDSATLKTHTPAAILGGHPKPAISGRLKTGHFR